MSRSGETAIDLEDLLAILRERKVNLACPVCRSKDLERVEGMTGSSIALLYEAAGARWLSPPGFMRVIPAVCARCGHTMLFSADKVAGWLKGG